MGTHCPGNGSSSRPAIPLSQVDQTAHGNFGSMVATSGRGKIPTHTPDKANAIAFPSVMPWSFRCGPWTFVAAGWSASESRSMVFLMRVRGLVWLIALCAFLLPPAFAPTTAMASSDHVSISDCPYHAPPPQPCPDKGTARHAAGTCCPLMAAMVALMPSAPEYTERQVQYDYMPSVATEQPGLLFTKDPPPPRV
jgi:hypothetical protein